MIAILGAHGQLGTAFMRLLGEDAHPVTRSELDLTNSQAIDHWFRRHQPEIVVNCAAYTAVDRAETQQDVAHAVNALAVGHLARHTAEIGAKFITFSTDYVFDGHKADPYVESDTPKPLNVYGETKLEGEHLAFANNPHTLVIRTSWLLSDTHPNFVTRVLDELEKGFVEVVDDQRGCPTFAADLSDASRVAWSQGLDGLLHLTNSGTASWHELACLVAQMAGHPVERVKPVPSSRFARAAQRPANSVLATERPFAGSSLPEYQTRLEAVVVEHKQRRRSERARASDIWLH